jgi:methyl-accepting chemotaxis protein
MLNAAAGEFFANAKQQARGATNQSSAVEQVRRTLETLLKSAREIGSTAEDVLESAERSQKNSQNVAEKIAALSHQTRSIAEILEVIKDIANKSDLLALNAGLEGTKAGEAGKGFSLVASQMQRLAENVMGAVRNIKELTTTITESTQATVLATEESTKLATDTTRSARQIGLTIQQQQSGTEQAVVAMVDVGEVASQTASGSKEIVSSATDLMKLSEQLQALVGRFRVGQASVPERHAAE